MSRFPTHQLNNSTSFCSTKYMVMALNSNGTPLQTGTGTWPRRQATSAPFKLRKTRQTHPHQEFTAVAAQGYKRQGSRANFTPPMFSKFRDPDGKFIAQAQHPPKAVLYPADVYWAAVPHHLLCDTLPENISPSMPGWGRLFWAPSRIPVSWAMVEGSWRWPLLFRQWCESPCFVPASLASLA